MCGEIPQLTEAPDPRGRATFCGELRSHYYHGKRRAQAVSSLRVRREQKIHNQRAARGCGAITITASRERRRKAACGCFYYYGERRARGESTRFTIKEQREAAEPLLSWQAESAGGEHPAGAARARDDSNESDLLDFSAFQKMRDGSRSLSAKVKSVEEKNSELAEAIAAPRSKMSDAQPRCVYIIWSFICS